MPRLQWVFPGWPWYNGLKFVCVSCVLLCLHSAFQPWRTTEGWRTERWQQLQPQRRQFLQVPWWADRLHLEILFQRSFLLMLTWQEPNQPLRSCPQASRVPSPRGHGPRPPLQALPGRQDQHQWQLLPKSCLALLLWWELWGSQWLPMSLQPLQPQHSPIHKFGKI